MTTTPELTATGNRVAGRLLVRPEEGADALGVSRARFYQMLSEGRVKSIKIGRSRRIPVTELESFITRELARQSA